MADEAKTEVISKEEYRSNECRGQIEEAKANIEKNYMTLAQLLHEAYENAYFIRWGYESFQQYCDEELNIKYRRARYLVVIAGVVKRCNLDWDRVISIGFTKMRTIAGLLTDENAKQWMEAAENNTVDQLSEMTKQSKKTGSTEPVTEEGSPKIISVQLRMNEDEAAIIMDAVERTKREIGTESMVTALEHISYEYIQQSGEGPVKADLKQVLGWVERVYGVELKPAGGQDLESLLTSDDAKQDASAEDDEGSQ